jgi:hypothetical protein
MLDRIWPKVISLLKAAFTERSNSPALCSDSGYPLFVSDALIHPGSSTPGCNRLVDCNHFRRMTAVHNRQFCRESREYGEDFAPGTAINNGGSAFRGEPLLP